MTRGTGLLKELKLSGDDRSQELGLELAIGLLAWPAHGRSLRPDSAAHRTHCL